MTDIKFRFKKTEKIISDFKIINQSNNIIYSKILEVFRQATNQEDAVNLIKSDNELLLLLKTFNHINNNLNVSDVDIEFLPHGRFNSDNKVLNFDYNISIYSQTLIAIGQDFKSLDKNNIRTACYIEKQQEIFILEFELANDKQILMVSL